MPISQRKPGVKDVVNPGRNIMRDEDKMGNPAHKVGNINTVTFGVGSTPRPWVFPSRPSTSSLAPLRNFIGAASVTPSIGHRQG